MVDKYILDRLKAARTPKAKAPPRPIRKVSLKRAEEKKSELYQLSEAALDQWYKMQMMRSKPICQNCNLLAEWLLEEKYEHIWRACQAHILPKKKDQFPMLATHEFNHMVLFPAWGGHLCGCHTKFDSSWDNAAKMSVFTIAKYRFEVYLLDEIPEDRKRLIPSVFIES